VKERTGTGRSALPYRPPADFRHETDTMFKPLAALLAAAALALPALAQVPNPLRVAVEAAYPPFSELGPDGKIKGFDIDIAEAVCARLKTRCQFVQTEFDAMIPALRAKKFDVIVASMSITPERRKVVDFSDKYYNTPARVVARADAAFDGTAAGLQGKSVGVQRTTIHDRYATATFKGAKIVRYAKQDEIYLDLLAGRLDATLADSVALEQGFLKTPSGKGYAFKGPVYNDPAFFGDGAGIAMRKGETALRDAVNGALAAIRADGTYRKLNDRYFSFDIYGAEPAKK
jgi:arginine/ornithine transport system substrate-binding protein